MFTANKQVVLLENEILRVTSLPGMGGKITSFFHKETSFEAAAQPGNNADSGLLGERPGAKSHEFAPYAYGMDDAFPNIDEESFWWKGRRRAYPDHGEIWSADFQVQAQEQDSVTLLWESLDFFYLYQKQMRLFGNALRLDYHIENTGKDELPAIWTWHGLMRYEEDMEILLPEGTGYCRNVLEDPKLGAPDTIYAYENPFYDFRKVPDATSHRSVKYYLEPERMGKRTEGTIAFCGFCYPSKNMRCLLRYDAGKLPYLGVWITAGGFQGDYNCALEPSNGFYDGIGRAERNRMLPILAPGEALDFALEISLEYKQNVKCGLASPA